MLELQACATTAGLCHAGEGAQGTEHANQALYQLSHIPSPSAPHKLVAHTCNPRAQVVQTQQATLALSLIFPPPSPTPSLGRHSQLSWLESRFSPALSSESKLLQSQAPSCLLHEVPCPLSGVAHVLHLYLGSGSWGHQGPGMGDCMGRRESASSRAS